MSNKTAPGAPGPEDKRTAGSVPMPKLKRRGMRGFLADTRSELKKVTWPTRHEANRLTGVVLSVCVMCVTILWLLSTAFGWILEQFFKSGR